MSNNPKLKKNGGEGTFVGNLLRTIVGVSPEILNILGTVTGVEGLNKLGDAIRGNSSISQTDKDLLLKELEKDIVVEQEISKREIEISKRWEYDMKFGSRLTRNIRPLVVANFTILIDIVIITSQWGMPLAEAYLPLLTTMGITAIGGYFTLREYGKTKQQTYFFLLPLRYNFNYNKMKSITKKELERLQELNTKFGGLKNQLGDLALQKDVVLKEINTVRTDFTSLEKKLIKKYGEDSVINLQTGEIKEKEQKMAKISNTLAYPNQVPINPEDYLIGTDALSNPIELQTKTFTIAGLADYILNIVTPPASSETFIVNGMFKAIGSNTGGGVGPEFSKDFLEWTSAVTPITQVPLWRVPVTLKLKLVTWAWVSDRVMAIPPGDTMTVSIGTVANNAISNYANYSKKEDLFVISDLYDKSYPRGEVDVSDLNIVLNAFQNIGVVCEGSLNSGITPTDGDMELSFYFEKTNSIAPILPVTVTLNPFNNNIIDNTAGAPNYTLVGNELNDTKQGQPGVSYQFITNGLANTGYRFKASAPFTAANPGGIFTVDGTETQTLTGEIEVVPITPVGPEWTSTDPVAADTYPNLEAGDTWTYNWTTSDDNTPCADLDYLITVDGVEIFPAAGASWLTFTDNGDCTGTLTGTYPGGNINVVMTVTDNDGLSATQDFTMTLCYAY